MAPLHIAVISGEFAAAIAFGAILDVIKIPFFARLHIACTAEVHQVFKGFDKQNREDQHEDRISPYRELLYISASARVSDLPREIKGGLDPQQIAKILGESLRQHFIQSGISETVKGLQATTAVMTSSQKELTTALHNLSDSHGGVAAQVEYANNRIEHSLEGRAKTMDALLHEWESDLLRIWIPLVAGAAMLVGLFGGIEIQGCRDAVPTAAATPTQTAAPAVLAPAPQENGAPDGRPKAQRRTREKAQGGAGHER